LRAAAQSAHAGADQHHQQSGQPKLIATIVSAVPLPEARIAVVPSAAPIGSDVSNLARQISHWRIPGKRLTRDPRRSDQRDARLFKVG
jgi:hypothetical protein